MIELPPLGDLVGSLWDALLDIAERMPDDWTLVGGQMVLLHAIEHGRTPPRISQDLDLVVDARVRPHAIPKMMEALSALGFEPAPISFDEIAHRFTRGEVAVDILAPEGTGPRTSLATIGRAETVPIKGGTYALNSSEPVEVTTARGRTGVVHRPDLAGALLVKSRATRSDHRRGPERHLTDLAFLYSLVQDPVAIGEQLGRAASYLARANELDAPDSEHWAILADDDVIADAQAARNLILAARG